MSAWRPMRMRRVINEFVRVSFTVPLQPTHELSIVEETDDFFPLLRSHRSSSIVFFLQASSVPYFDDTAFCKYLQLVQFNGYDYTYCSKFYSTETDISLFSKFSVTYFQIV